MSIQSACDVLTVTDYLAQGIEHMVKALGADIQATADAHVVRCIELLMALRSGLDMNKGQLADDLNELYFYMQSRLWKYGESPDAEILAEVSEILVDQLEGWQQLQVA